MPPLMQNREDDNHQDIDRGLGAPIPMEKLRQIGEVMGSLRALMAFQDEIRINKRQCSLLVDALNLAFEVIMEEIKQNLSFDERLTPKWKALEHPLRELHRICREAEQYVRRCMEPRSWWTMAITLGHSADCVELHLHSLLWCVPVVLEAVEAAGEIAGCDQDDIHRRRVAFSKKYEKEWLDPSMFQHQYGRRHLVSPHLCSRMEAVQREDRWAILHMAAEKRSPAATVLSKQELRLADLVEGSKKKLFPSWIMVASKDYQVRRRLGSGCHYKEVQWLGESFAVRHFFGDIQPLVPEILHLSTLDHPNILPLFCAFSDEEGKECFLLTELMQRTLCNHIKENCGPRRKVPFPLPVAVDIMLQIARGMEYLHSRGICHGNLNPSIIFVRTRNSSPDGYLLVKIAGIGLSTVKNPKTSTNQTATNPCIWLAPEVLLEQEQAAGNPAACRYSEKADVYSFGMVCFELLTGKVPFEDGQLQGDKMIRNIRAGERPLLPFTSPKYLTGLTKRCWQADPSQRPSFSAICRVLRHIKRFLLLNPDHSMPDAPSPPLDYFDLEASLCRRFPAWAAAEAIPVSQLPFQMFAYRVAERERTCVSLKEKSSESGSDGASVSGDDNIFSSIMGEDPFAMPVGPLKSSPAHFSSDVAKKPPAKYGNRKANKDLGKNFSF